MHAHSLDCFQDGRPVRGRQANPAAIEAHSRDTLLVLPLLVMTVTEQTPRMVRRLSCGMMGGQRPLGTQCALRGVARQPPASNNEPRKARLTSAMMAEGWNRGVTWPSDPPVKGHTMY